MSEQAVNKGIYERFVNTGKKHIYIIPADIQMDGW